MSNTTTFRQYPYVREFWQDLSGTHRWTVKTSSAAILSALLAMLIAFTLGRLIYVVYTSIHLTILQRKASSLIDDQANVIAVNAYNPSVLLGNILQFSVVTGRRSIASTTVRAVAIVALLFLAIQGALVFAIGRLVSSQPLPLSIGTCGFPQFGNLSVGTDFVIAESHYISQFQKASSKFEDCQDIGNKITCPGVAGQTFSWDVFESEPGQCWFGSENCYPGSRTITQKATIFRKDFGVLGKSRLSVTILAECSHVDNSNFIARGYNPGLNASFTAYQYGVDPAYEGIPFLQNATTIIYDDEFFMVSDYVLQYEPYNVPGNLTTWKPVPFLSDNLDSPFAMENTSASSSLMLLFNSIMPVKSFLPNTDPFFEANRTEEGFRFYLASHKVTTLACRDQIRLEIQPSARGNDGFIATGTMTDVQTMFEDYRARIDPNGSMNETWKELDEQASLYSFPLYPSVIFNAVDKLAGNALRAQRTVKSSVQFGQPENVTTRAEVTRWFGVSMLYTLNWAQVLTSGTDNDWGFGIFRYPDWVSTCDNTLRTSAEYTSLNLIGLIVLFIAAILIIIASYLFQPFLWWFLRLKHHKPWSPAARSVLVSQNLHGSLQLHRIAVEETSGQRFNGTLNTIPVVRGGDSKDAGSAPVYGIAQRSPQEQRIEGFGDRKPGSPEITQPLRDEKNVATMLRESDLRTAVYDVDYVW